MKRSHNNLNESDDDGDNLPLKYISAHKKIISMKELRKYSIHACEFCEKSFKNRYDYLIHNAKHIIIPLIKMLPYYCVKCDWYCISEEEMNEHILLEHETFSKSKKPAENNNTKESDRSTFEIEDVNEELNEDTKSLDRLSDNKSDDMTQCSQTENILQNFMMTCKVDIEKMEAPWQCQPKGNDNKSGDANYRRENNFKTVAKSTMKTDGVSVTNNAMKFKKSAEENNILKIKSKEDTNPEGFSESLSESDLEDDPIVILAPVKEQTVTENHGQYNECSSVHFQDLIKPGIFYCKICFKRFPNRYEVIIHEQVHLDLSKASPQSYKDKHRTQPKSTIPLSSNRRWKHKKRNAKCDRCNEIINDKIMHEKTCFRLHCITCGKGFNWKSTLATHEGTCNREFVVNLCDLCLYARDKPKHVYYCGIVRCAKLEVKQECHWCGEPCEDVSLVTLKSRQRLADRIRFEGDVGEINARVCKSKEMRKVSEKVEKRGNGVSERAGRGAKVLTNWDRLKIIQNRLKLMKK